jgi:transcription antitermination factor NusG
VNWFVLHTRSRQEKLVAAALQTRGIPFILPLVREVRYYGRRKVPVERPLFPGYVFLNGAIEDAYALERSGRVANVITVADQNRLAWELENLNNTLTADGEASLHPYPYLRKGVRVEVRSGPFRGVQGLIADRAKRDCLILQVSLLGQAVSLELEGALLDPI